ncbi:MAG: AAA family ATPase [Microscillaceae bacterium]|nr:AAA family ATPase [Microscillaceae bacterium]
MENRMFTQIWDQLRVKKRLYNNYLDQINIKQLRGIKDLSVTFNYPVTVIAGPNASGKSTVLFTCACAYEPQNANPRNYTPASLFPNLYSSKTNSFSDKQVETSFEFYYSIQKKKLSMRWAKGKSWNKSYMGQKNSKQPINDVYLRTLANLTSPSEVRAVLQISNSPKLEVETITSDLLAFAQRILPIQYSQVSLIKKESRDLLFINRGDVESTSYSEFHMSAGERAILRISKDISNLKNALILIDEIEAGLHPFTQQQLMLELQRIALRNDLQIIVTSHSPVILDAVPPEARIFLERTIDNVIEKPAYKEIIQKALYGQSTEKLSLLCEDEIGENFVLGVLDYINPKLNLVHDDIIVGRDTGKEEFPSHITALGKFGKLNEFIFVLDGDAKDLNSKLKEAATKVQPGVQINPLNLPGVDIPETWAWSVIKNETAKYASLFGISEPDLIQKITQQDQLFDNAADKKTNISKNKFFSFCEQLKRNTSDIIRIISREETKTQKGEIKIFSDELEQQIRNWQSRK